MRIDSGLLTNPTSSSVIIIPPLTLFLLFFFFLSSLQGSLSSFFSSLSLSLNIKPLAPALYSTLYTPIGALSINHHHLSSTSPGPRVTKLT